ncbi:MAG: hypothetical protein ACJ79R_24300 [Anaeromyxobacteraceae bacterium]
MDRRTYRTQLWLRIAIILAVAAWGGALLALAHFPAAPPGTVLAAAGFLAFFVAYGAVYDQTRIAVGPEGVVFRGVLTALPVRWDEIVRVDVHRGLAGTLYAVLTRRGLIRFTSVLARHRELCDLLLDRGALRRLG